MFLISTTNNKFFDEESVMSHLYERLKCYESLRIVFDNTTSFTNKLKETKQLCENNSYFVESFYCLLAIFYFLPHYAEAKDSFQDICQLYSQICEIFPRSDYFQFFNVQMARFLCKFPVEGELKYLPITNLVCKKLRKIQDEKVGEDDYLEKIWHAHS